MTKLINSCGNLDRFYSVNKTMRIVSGPALQTGKSFKGKKGQQGDEKELRAKGLGLRQDTRSKLHKT